MIGALIGDLAAWTYEHDRKAFYSQLITQQAKLSVYGDALLASFCAMEPYNPMADYKPVGTPIDNARYYGQWLMWQVAWTMSLCQFCDKMEFEHIDKEEFYALHYLLEFINPLLEGKPKNETFQKVSHFKTSVKQFHVRWRNPVDIEKDETHGVLKCLCRAWDSFNKGFDFTSSIHNAMRWADDRHLTAALTGLLACAMYGCQYGYIKKKYAGEIGAERFDLWDTLYKAIEQNAGLNSPIINSMILKSNQPRTFFPKNHALTNVERHHWKRVKNLFDREKLTDEEKDKLLRAGCTGWDNRYGLYLDDGKIYLYRCGSLIGRFLLAPHHRGGWCICGTELSDKTDYKEFWNGLTQALYATCHVIKESHKEATRYIQDCKYYNGEFENPFKAPESNEARFWHGEMMFMTEVIDREQWATYAETLPFKEKWAKKLTKPQQAMVAYMECLYGKWCPMEDNSWLNTY